MLKVNYKGFFMKEMRFLILMFFSFLILYSKPVTSCSLFASDNITSNNIAENNFESNNIAGNLILPAAE